MERMEKRGYDKGTVLHVACEFSASIEIINRLIEIGGRELVMTTDDDEYTALHLACGENASNETINALIDIGGEELVMSTNDYESTALHLACEYNASIETINSLIEFGGRELVMSSSTGGETALYVACENNASIDIINELISIRGRELLMITGNNGYTALQNTFYSNASSIEIINRLIEIGGRELVMATDDDECTALHIACQTNVSIDVINALIDIGGKELLMAINDDGNTPLHILLLVSGQSTNIINKASSLISSGIIQDQVGGEFGIGRLFNFASEEQGQPIIFQDWNYTILPALEMNTALISRQPILQAAIITRAPLHIIQDIISQLGCITTQDSRGRYPIDVAVAEAITWGDGMEDIVCTHTEALIVDWQGQAQLMINVAALHGLKWENRMKEVAVESREDVRNPDALTG